jgi:hypothetical protein
MTPEHLQEAKAFLEVFCTHEELNSITWQTFDDSEHKSPGLVTVRAGKLETHLPDLERVNGEGAGVFWTVNPQTDPRKRNKGNTARVRTVFTDLDGAPLEPVKAFALPPTAIIESSLGRYHAYWKVSDVPLTEFEGVQKRLAAHFNGDPVVHDLPRVMRFPYFMHNKGEAFQTKILEFHPERVYTLEQLNAALPQVQPTAPMSKPLTRATQNASSSDDAARKYVLTAFESECTILRNAPEGQGNVQINKSAFALGQLVGAGGLSESEVRDALEQVVNSWAKPDPSAAASIRSGLEAGKLEPRDLSEVGKKPLNKAWQNIRDAKDSSKKASSSEPLNFTEKWGRYAIENGVIVEVKEGKNAKGDSEEYAIPLCNFQARINAEVMRDDGAEQTAVFSLSGSLSTGEVLPTRDILASQFGGMNWVTQNWGARAVVYAGQSTRDKLREAIQTRSLDTIESRTVFAHTGWRKLEPHGWVYLHAAGGLGKDGAVSSIKVQLTGSLERYALPEPLTDLEQTRKAVRSSLEFLNVAPYRVTVPVWLAVYRSVIDAARFTVFLFGRTGSRKSGLAALALQHLAPTANWDALTTQWTATDNALERVLFEAKDSLTVIDDFNPTGNAQDVRKYHARAERVLRAQGNGGGRSRMRADLTLRPEMPPRGMTISTGEDLPHGHSLRARCLILEVRQGDVNLERVIALSSQARDGVLAHAMTAFIQWLASDLEQHREILRKTALEAQTRFTASHGRTSAAAGELLATLKLWQAFALERQFITRDESTALEAQVIEALNLTTKAQASHQEASDPAQRFPQLLRGLLFSGKAHLVSAELEQEPNDPQTWGWREKTIGTGENQRTEWQAQGSRIGWVTTPKDNSEASVYLEPSAAFTALSRYAQESDEAIVRTQKTLWGELAAKGYVFSESGESGQNTVKRSINGSRPRDQQSRPRVLHLTSACIKAVLEGEASRPESPDCPETIEETLFYFGQSNEGDSTLEFATTNNPSNELPKNPDPLTPHFAGLSGQGQETLSPTQETAPCKTPCPDGTYRADNPPELEQHPRPVPALQNATGQARNRAANQAVLDNVETPCPESPVKHNIGGSGFFEQTNEPKQAELLEGEL